MKREKKILYALLTAGLLINHLRPHNHLSAPLAAQRLYAALENPESFLRGASTSTHQCSGLCHTIGIARNKHICDWSDFAQTHGLAVPNDTTAYPADLLKHGTSYIDQLKEKLNINALRLSIEWPLIQPDGPESWSFDIIEKYADLFIHMVKNGITPVICFHHYTSPSWFAEKNGFEKTENNQFFQRYCKVVYSLILDILLDDPQATEQYKELYRQQRPPLWATFNSPEGVAFKGYQTFEAPPSNPHKKGLKWVAKTLGNMLNAHVETYHQIKQFHNHLFKDLLPEPKIGFLKNITQLDIAKDSLLSYPLMPATYVCCKIGQEIQSESIYRFFTTGKFEIKWLNLIEPQIHPYAPYALDWIGVNYYSNQLLFLKNRKTENPESPTGTDNSNYRIYPHGLYRAIKEIHTNLVHPLSKTLKEPKIPVYITENGIATNNEEKRATFYGTYIDALTHAIEKGYPVKGYLVWTAFDNYEWPKPTEKETAKKWYGLCSVSPDGLTLSVKPGATYYAQFNKNFEHQLHLNKEKNNN